MFPRLAVLNPTWRRGSSRLVVIKGLCGCGCGGYNADDGSFYTESDFKYLKENKKK